MMQEDLNNLYLSICKNNTSNSSILMKNISSFILMNPEYSLTHSEARAISYIIDHFIQNNINEKDFVSKIQKLIVNYFCSNHVNYINRISFARKCILSKIKQYQDISIEILTFIIQNPDPFGSFLKTIENKPDFCKCLMSLTYNQSKKICLLYSNLAKELPLKYYIDFANSYTGDDSKLKILKFIIPQFERNDSSDDIKCFIESINPESIMVLVYLIGHISDKSQIVEIIRIIASNFNYVNIGVLCNKISRYNVALYSFFNAPSPLSAIEKVIERVHISLNNQAETRYITQFTNGDDSERNIILKIWFFMSLNSKEKIKVNILNLIPEYFNNKQSYQFLRNLIDNNLFLYPTDPAYDNFLKNISFNFCNSPEFLNFYAAIITIFPTFDNYSFIFEKFIELNISNQSDNDSDLDDLIGKSSTRIIIDVFLDSNNLDQCTRYLYLLFRQNFSNYPKLIIAFLKKYFKQCEYYYPIIDFNFINHNKKLHSDKNFEIFVGTYSFKVNINDKISNLDKRISNYFENFHLDFSYSPEIKISDRFGHTNNHIYRDKELLPSKKVLPTIFFYQNDIIPLLLGYSDNENNLLKNKKTISNIAAILNILPDDLPNSQESEDKVKILTKMINETSNILRIQYALEILTNDQNIHKNYMEINSTNILPSLLNFYVLNENNNIIGNQNILIFLHKFIPQGYDYSNIFKFIFSKLKSKDHIKKTFTDFLQYLMKIQKNELTNYIGSNLKDFQKNPPEIIWDIIFDLIKKNNIQIIDLLKQNSSNDFGYFIADKIMNLYSNDIKMMSNLLYVQQYNSTIYISKLTELFFTSSTTDHVNKRIIKQLFIKSLITDKNGIKDDIFNKIFPEFLKNSSFKQLIIGVALKQLNKIDSNDFSFDTKNHDKSNFGIKLIPAPFTSPLNAILQCLLNINNFLNYIYQNKSSVTEFFYFADSKTRNCFDPMKYQFQINPGQRPLDVLKQISDDIPIFQFNENYAELNKSIIVIYGINNFNDYGSQIFKYGKRYKFKGLVAHDREYFAVIKRNKKFLKIVDTLITQINSHQIKEKIDLIFYVEKKRKKKINLPNFNLYDDKISYSKLLSAYSSHFSNFVKKLENINITLLYYTNFIIRMKDIRKIQTWQNELHDLSQEKENLNTDNFLYFFQMLAPHITMNFVKIDDDKRLENFRNFLVNKYLKYFPKAAVKICEILIESTDVLLFANPYKISSFISVVRDYFKICESGFSSQDIINIIRTLYDIVNKSLDIGNTEECNHKIFYSKLDIHSVFDILQSFWNSKVLNHSEKLTIIDIVKTYIMPPNQKVDLICMNSNNSKSFISLVQTTSGTNLYLIQELYSQLFDSGKYTEEQLIYFFIQNLTYTTNINLSYDNTLQELVNASFINFSTVNSILFGSIIKQFAENNMDFRIRCVSLMPKILRLPFFKSNYNIIIPILDILISIPSIEMLQECLNRVTMSPNESILEFKLLSLLIPKFYIRDNFLLMEEIGSRYRQNDDYSIIFGEFLIQSIPFGDVKPSHLYDIILFKFNIQRVNIALKFFNNTLFDIQNPSNAPFLLHKKMRLLLLYLYINDNINNLYDILHLFQRSNRYNTISSKVLNSDLDSQINISPKVASQIITFLLSMISSKAVFQKGYRMICKLIDNLTSKSYIRALNIKKIDSLNNIYPIIFDFCVNNHYKVHILKLMNYTILRCNNYFEDFTLSDQALSFLMEYDNNSPYKQAISNEVFQEFIQFYIYFFIQRNSRIAQDTLDQFMSLLHKHQDFIFQVLSKSLSEELAQNYIQKFLHFFLNIIDFEKNKKGIEIVLSHLNRESILNLFNACIYELYDYVTEHKDVHNNILIVNLLGKLKFGWSQDFNLIIQRSFGFKLTSFYQLHPDFKENFKL